MVKILRAAGDSTRAFRHTGYRVYAHNGLNADFYWIPLVSRRAARNKYGSIQSSAFRPNPYVLSARFSLLQRNCVLGTHPSQKATAVSSR